MIKTLLIFLLSLYSFEILCQVFHEGQFSIQNISPGYDLGKPSADYHRYKGTVLHFALKDSTYAVVLKDSRGEIINRSVYDLGKNKYYSVGKVKDFWMHQSDSISYNSSFYKKQNSGLNFFYTGLTVDPEKINFKGFNCYQIKMISREYGKVTLLATDQIEIPSTGLDPYHQTNLLDSVVILKATYENDDWIVNSSIDTFYTTIQNPEWLIPAQEGAITIEEYNNLKFQKALQSSNNQQEIKGDNLDVGILLNKYGLLSESDIESHLKNNEDVDKLFWMSKTEYLSRSITYDSLINLWNKAGLISPLLDKQIEKYKLRHWQDSRENFFDMMTILMLNEMVSDRKNRETIIANMSTERYLFKPGSAKTKTDFLNGLSDVSTLFMAVDGMYPIPPFYKTKDKSKIENEVLKLLGLVFPELATELKVWISLEPTGSRLHVSTKKFQYQTEIYREYGWEEEGHERTLKKLNEFNFNFEFLLDFEKVLKQIGTDYQNHRIYGCRSFAENLNNMDSDNYVLLAQKYPELSLFKNLWYLGALDRSLADWTADIKISYQNTEMAYYQSDFNSLYLCSSLVEYIPSEDKRMVIEFMQHHQLDLNVSDDAIKTVEDNLLYELIELNDEIGKFIPGIKYTISRSYEKFLTQIPTNVAFSDFFPRIYTFIRQDFNPMLMGLSDDTSELYWKDEAGMMDTIPMNFHSTEESILAFLHKKLKPTGYGIYSIPTLRMTEKQYYYLTQQQKIELEAILNDRLVEIN